MSILHVLSTENPRQNVRRALGIVTLTIAILALNAAGQLHFGPVGLLGLFFLFMLLGWAGCYWYLASIHFLTQLMTVEPRRQQPWFVILQGAWPLIFLGPAMSAQRVWSGLGLALTLFVLLCGIGTSLLALRRAYYVGWPQAFLCVGITVFLGSLALVGVIGWPSMLVLGTKNLSLISAQLIY